MKFKKKNGLTLIEIVITIALIGAIGLIVVSLTGSSLKNYRVSQETIRVQDKVAAIMRDFESVARGTTEVITAESGQFELYAYLAGDAHPAPSKIRYYFENGTISKGKIAPDGAGPTYLYPAENEEIEVLSEDITEENLFKYYSDVNFDYDNEESTILEEPVSTTAVRMVRISISSDKNLDQPPGEITEITLVSLRNLKSNL